MQDYTSASPDALVQTLISFVESVGIPVRVEPLTEPTALPGITIDKGSLIVDTERLLYPGDILHEAGHIAVVPPEVRARMTGNIDPKEDLELAGEFMAIPWSYAACIHLGIDPHIVFHEHGYQGGGAQIVENYRNGGTMGLPMLQWVGMSYEPRKAKESGVEAFPTMIRWMRE